MPDIPAYCDTCGTVFSSGIFIENATNVTLEGNKAGPCPTCGGWGSVRNGVFNFIGNAIEVLNSPARTSKELQRFSEILITATNEQMTLEQIEDEIQKELPEFNTLLSFLRSIQTKFPNLALWINTLVMIIAMSSAGAEEPTQKPEITQVINNIYLNVETTHTTTNNYQTIINNNSLSSINKSIKVEKVGRNETCPCGSGKKYKNCHLQLEGVHPIVQ